MDTFEVKCKKASGTPAGIMVFLCEIRNVVSKTLRVGPAEMQKYPLRGPFTPCLGNSGIQQFVSMACFHNYSGGKFFFHTGFLPCLCVCVCVCVDVSLKTWFQGCLVSSSLAWDPFKDRICWVLWSMKLFHTHTHTHFGQKDCYRLDFKVRYLMKKCVCF